MPRRAPHRARKPLAFAIAFLSLLLFGSLVSAQYFPNFPGHPLSQVYTPSMPGGLTPPPGGRISVDGNLNSFIDNADFAVLAATATYAQTAGALGAQGAANPTQSTQLLTRGCTLVLARTTGISPPSSFSIQTTFPQAQCIDGVCHLVLREIPLGGGVVDTSLYTYYQNSDGYWVADGQNPQAPNPIPSRNTDGKNGDGIFISLATHNSITLDDDSPAENSATQLSLTDASATHDAEVWLCSS